MRTLFLTLMMSFLSHSAFASDSEDVGADDEDCCICMCSMSEACQTLACSHKFHPKCVQEWLTNNPSCPLCRANLLPESFGRFLFENNIGGTVGALIAIRFIGTYVLLVIFVKQYAFPYNLADIRGLQGHP
jgi:hypothetical protein